METLALRITADGSLAVREVDRIARSMGGISTAAREVDRETDVLLSRMTAVAATAASAFSLREMSQAVDAWKDINAQLSIATGSVQAGAEAYRAVLEIAVGAGQSIEQVGTVYRRFAENAFQLGLSQQQVANTTRTVAQAIALSGGTAQSAQAALTQFGQALASGTLRGEELNSVLEQAPALARALADGLRVPIGQLRKLAEEGRITSDEIVRALDSQSTRIAANFEKLPMTMGRALENVRSRWIDVMGSFESSTGVFGSMATAVGAAAKNLDVLVAASGALAAIYGGRMAGALAAAIAAKIADAAATVRQAQAMASASMAAQQYTGLMLSQATAVRAAAAGMGASATAFAAAGTVARTALSALGGPIGAVTTALTLGAAAWMVWGNRAGDAVETAGSDLGRIDNIIDKMDELNGRIDQMSRRAVDAAVSAADAELQRVGSEIRRLQNVLGLMGGQVAGQGANTEAAAEMRRQMNFLIEREAHLHERVGEARRRSAEAGTAALAKFIEANATGADKIALQQRKILTEFAQAVEQTGGVFDFENARHVAALRALNAALADVDKDAGKSAAALVKQQYADRLDTIKSALAAEDDLLKIARARGELDERAYLDRLTEAQRSAFAARAALLRDQLATATKPEERARILGDIQKLGAEAAAAANASTLAYVELDKAARATLATLTSEAWGEAGKIATDNAALREELVTLGMTTAQLDAYRRQKTLAAQESENAFVAALEAAAAAIEDEGAEAQRAKQYYLDLAAARRAAAEQLGERATLERQLATSREALRLSTESAKVWQEGWQETDRIARDAFVAWADDGASAAERIGQSLRAALLSAIYEATLRPIALQVYTTAAGALGLSSGAAGAGAGGNLLGMASNAKSLYDLASGDYGLYGSFATSQYGQALGLSTAGVAASSIGTGSSLGFGGLFANGATAGSTSGVASMSTLGSALPWAAGGGILAGVLYGGKGQSAAGGAIGAGVGYAAAAGSGWAAGASMGSAAGPIGALAGAIIGGFLGSKIGGGGERFKTTYGSASGLYDDGRYTSTGAWQGGRQYGDDVDQVLDRATQAFSARLGSLYAAFGLDDQIAAQASVRLRRTSGRLASDFYADLDGDGPQGLTTLLQAQYGGDGEVEGALGEFVTAILTKGIKSAVEKSDLPEIVKQLYAPLTETADIEAATVTILAAQQILVGAGTTMADFLGSTAESYLRGEENLIGMLDRTVTALAAVNPVLEDIGLAAIEFTLAGGDLASQLAAISGGLDAFVGQASTYYQQFFSEEERLGRLSVRLAEQFEALGYAMPTDHAGFRALVEGLGEIDESTAGTFAALMNLAPAFDTVADAAKAAANNAIKAAEEHERTAATAVRTAATAVRSAFSAYEQAVRAQLTTDLAALDARHEALLPQMDARRSLVSQLGPMIDSIGDAVQHLRGTASPAAGSRSLDELLRGTFAGTLPDADALQQAIRGVTGDAAGNYATRADWQRAQAANAAKLDTLGGLMGKQKTLAEEALAVLEREVQAIEAQTASLETAASAQIDLMRQQVDGLLGIDSGVKSVEAAITQLSAAMQVYRSAQNAAVSADPARSNPNVGTVPSNAAPGVKSAYAHTSGVNVNPGDSALLAAAKVLYQAATGGVSTAQFNRAAASVGGDIAAAVGWKGDPAELRQRYGFAQGTNYVPWNMTADIHEGERIIPAADNRQLMDLMRRGANGGGATIDLTALLEEVRMLRAEMRATAQHSGKTARLIERVIPDGDALAVRAAA